MSILKRVCGICGMLASIIGVVAISIAIAISPWFGWTNNALSDLGATGNSSTPVFNYGLIIAGIFAFVFSIGLIESINHRTSRAGAIILSIAAIGLTGIGVFNFPHPLHAIASGIFFILMPIALFLI